MADVLLFVPFVAAFPLFVYSLQKISQEKNKEYIQKRKYSVILGFNFVLLLNTIGTSLSAINQYYLHDNDPLHLLLIKNLQVITGYLTFFYLNVKTWMIYFQYHWSLYTLQFEWQQCINTKFVQKENRRNWFIKNKSTYGQLTDVYKLFACIHITFGIICLCCISFSQFTESDTINTLLLTTTTIVSLPLVLFYAIITAKTPSDCRDSFYINRENKVTARILLTAFAASIIISMIKVSVFDGKYDEDHPIMLIMELIAGYPWLFLWMSLNILSTLVVMQKNKVSNAVLLALQEDLNRKLDLEGIINDAEKVNAFMKYLSREFSIFLMITCAYIYITEHS